MRSIIWFKSERYVITFPSENRNSRTKPSISFSRKKERPELLANYLMLKATYTVSSFAAICHISTLTNISTNWDQSICLRYITRYVDDHYYVLFIQTSGRSLYRTFLRLNKARLPSSWKFLTRLGSGRGRPLSL